MSGYTVLVPLDGDEVSEDALLAMPMLQSIGFTRARLLSVDSPRNMKTRTASALVPYLDGHKAALEAAGWDVETVIVVGEAEDAIVSAAGSIDVDLVLLATHGRRGMKRLRLGSTSDKVIKNATCPRLVVGPNVDIDLQTYSLKRILVPVDGSELSEMSLPIARHLARLSGATVNLVQAVSTSSAGMIGDAGFSAGTLPGEIEAAEQYLSRLGEGFPGTTVETSVAIGPAGDTILNHLQTNEVDLVIIASRGRTGLARAALGSVTEQLLQGPDPILVFEVGEDRSKLFEAARTS